MPNAKNLPTDFAAFQRRSKLTRKDYAVPLLNRFSYRYRLAESFEGMIAPNVGRTLKGYNVITKVFLAYTAYESIVKAASRLKINGVLPINLNTIFDKQLCEKLRKNNKLKKYLLSSNSVDTALSNKLKLVFNSSTSDIVCIAYGIRNVFGHGDLTASVIDTDTVAKRKVFTDLASVLLDYCDDTFSHCVNKL